MRMTFDTIWPKVYWHMHIREFMEGFPLDFGAWGFAQSVKTA